ncbi:NUDIX domain-containing protein [Fontisphaera persica]|uniref:NUDIX domain-containing protein n=1 Tax=Fontisphaera persica TaxID=2974023 RepID=UPI0024C0A6EE|nr:NUDIX domain-containing protein [Fontisphaera persica]WCJ58788.1 NUDIX domain-containing protein [Fontisphaera persica]
MPSPPKRSRVSAGLLMYRFRPDGPEVLLAHPGGPFFEQRDWGYWSIPKGEVHEGEDLLATALREFYEETGIAVPPTAEFVPLGHIQQKGGKIVHAWAVLGEIEPKNPPPSSTFTLEWPPDSGHMQEFPEVDRIEFFPFELARRKIKITQVPLINRLEEGLKKSW